MEQKTDLKPMTLKISDDLKKKAQEKAKKQGLNLSLLIRKLLTDYVEDRQGKLFF